MFKKKICFFNLITSLYIYCKCENFLFLNILSKLEPLLVLLIIVSLFFFLKRAGCFYICICNYITQNSVNSLNKNLLNGIVNIHPVIYVLFVFCIVNLCLFFFFKKKIVPNLHVLLRSLTILLILGSFWAAQELSWGGWWSWDITECTILFVFVYILFVSHVQRHILYNYYVIVLLFNFTVIFYFFNKTSLILSVHAFDTLYDNNYIIFCVLFVVLLSTYKSNKIITLTVLVFLSYLYSYMLIIITTSILFYFVFARNYILTVILSNFYKFFGLFSLKHFFFFFVICINLSFYSFILYVDYFLIFNNTNLFFGFSEFFNFYDSNKFVARAVYTNFFYSNTVFFFFIFKKAQLFLCAVSYYIILIFFLSSCKMPIFF